MSKQEEAEQKGFWEKKLSGTKDLQVQKMINHINNLKLLDYERCLGCSKCKIGTPPVPYNSILFNDTWTLVCKSRHDSIK